MSVLYKLKRLAVSLLMAGVVYSSLSALSKDAVLLDSGAGEVCSLAWIAAGQSLAAATRKGVFLYSGVGGTAAANRGVLTGEPAFCVKGSQSGDRLLYITESGVIAVQYMTGKADRFTIPTNLPGGAAASFSSADSIYLSHDGGTINRCFHLRITGKNTFYKFSDSEDVFSIDTAGSYLLATAIDGQTELYSVDKGGVIFALAAYMDGGVYPSLSPDGSSVLFASDGATLVVRGVSGSGTMPVTISTKDPSRLSFANAAVFSPDSRSVAAACSDGTVCLYNTQTGAQIGEIYPLRLAGDEIKCLAFVSGGRQLAAGTQNGDILLWNVTDMIDQPQTAQTPAAQPVASVPQPVQPAVTQPVQPAQPTQPAQTVVVEKVVEKEVEKKTSTHFPSEVFVLGSLSSVPSDSYTGAFGLDVGYRMFRFYPFYFGADLEARAAKPSDGFPYSYVTTSGETVGAPWLYSFMPAASAGYAHELKKSGIMLFVETSAGPAFRMLYNNSREHAHYGNMHTSFYGTLSGGLEWRFLRVQAGGEYDSSLGASFFMKAGFTFHLGNWNSIGEKK